MDKALILQCVSVCADLLKDKATFRKRLARRILETVLYHEGLDIRPVEMEIPFTLEQLKSRIEDLT